MRASQVFDGVSDFDVATVLAAPSKIVASVESWCRFRPRVLATCEGIERSQVAHPVARGAHHDAQAGFWLRTSSQVIIVCVRAC